MMDQWRSRLPNEDWSPAFSGAYESMPAEALDAAVRILRLLPEIERLTLSGPLGPVEVERRSSVTAWRAADRVTMALLAASSEITGVVAHPFDPRDGFRLATPSDPFLTRDGGVPAAIRASEHLGEISPAEAERRQSAHLGGIDLEDPLETLWDEEPARSPSGDTRL